MSEMGDWINQLASSGAFQVVGDRAGRNGLPAGLVEAGTPPPPTGHGVYGPEVLTPTPRVDQPVSDRRTQANAGMPPTVPDIGTPPVEGGTSGPSAPLEMFLRMYQMTNAAGTGIPQEMYDYFGGDAILAELQKYDPGVHWEDVMVGGGGEGGGAGTAGKKLVGSTPGLIAVPTSKSGLDLNTMRPSNFGSNGLHNPNMIYHDDVYGDVTHAGNVKKGKTDWWEYAAPAAIGLLAPMAGAALMAGGIGAGSTAAVTGGAAGLGAGNIAMGGVPSWWTNMVSKAPQVAKGAAPYLHSQPSAPMPRPPQMSAPNFGMPDPYGFNPSAFNNMGSAAKTGGGDSSMVATQFAADPYGFSKG